jgi:hypothetical protein
MQAPGPRLITICRTELTGSETAEGSVFLFRHTTGLYGDFFTVDELEVMEVNKESVTKLPKTRV